MRLTAKIKLLATPEQKEAMKRTMRVANDLCNWVSKVAWEKKVFRPFALHPIAYHEGRKKFSTAAQITTRLIAKVAEAYALDSKRQRKFSALGAIPFDDRLLSWKADSVFIWTMEGRQRITFAAGPGQQELLKTRQGQSDLIYHRGEFYLAAACNIEEPTIQQVDDFLGVDFGVKNIATDSDGGNYSGSGLNNVRYRHRKLRDKLKRIGTPSAKRKLQRLSGKETRFAQDVNHCVAKQIVASAKRTKRGIAVEDLSGIRSRIRARRDQRAVLHSWAFYMLKTFILYKAELAGIPVIQVDPRNSSRECSRCHHVDKANRPSQSKFSCQSCGFAAHADYNAALNLRSRACTDRPIVARSLELQALNG